MHLSLHLPLLLALGHGASAVFTSPNPDFPLNVSAPTITVAWSTPELSRDDLRYLTVDMHFQMPMPGKADTTVTGWTENLVTNHSLTAGHFEWNTTQVREFLESHPDATKERKGAQVRFVLGLRGPADGGWIPEHLGPIKVSGYEGYVAPERREDPEGSVAATGPAWLLVAAGIVAAIQV